MSIYQLKMAAQKLKVFRSDQGTIWINDPSLPQPNGVAAITQNGNWLDPNGHGEDRGLIFLEQYHMNELEKLRRQRIESK